MWPEIKKLGTSGCELPIISIEMEYVRVHGLDLTHPDRMAPIVRDRYKQVGGDAVKFSEDGHHAIWVPRWVDGG